MSSASSATMNFFADEAAEAHGERPSARNQPSKWLKMAAYAAIAVMAMAADAPLSVTSCTSARPSAGSARPIGALGRLIDALVRLSTTIGRAAQKSLLQKLTSTLAVRAKESVSERRRGKVVGIGIDDTIDKDYPGASYKVARALSVTSCQLRCDHTKRQDLSAGQSRLTHKALDS